MAPLSGLELKIEFSVKDGVRLKTKTQKELTFWVFEK